MPGAGYDGIGEFALAKRAAAMQADVTDGVKLAADIGERNGLLPKLHFPKSACRDIRDSCGALKRHAASLRLL